MLALLLVQPADPSEGESRSPSAPSCFACCSCAWRIAGAAPVVPASRTRRVRTCARRRGRHRIGRTLSGQRGCIPAAGSAARRRAACRRDRRPRAPTTCIPRSRRASWARGHDPSMWSGRGWAVDAQRARGPSRHPHALARSCAGPAAGASIRWDSPTTVDPSATGPVRKRWPGRAPEVGAAWRSRPRPARRSLAAAAHRPRSSRRSASTGPS